MSEEKYKEKIRDGEKVKELDCPPGFKAVDGKCRRMKGIEKRNRSRAAEKVKRSDGNRQKYIDRKRIDTMEKLKEGVDVKNELKRGGSLNKKNWGIGSWYLETLTGDQYDITDNTAEKIVKVLNLKLVYTPSGKTCRVYKYNPKRSEIVEELRKLIRKEIKILLEVKEIKLPKGKGVAYVTKKGLLFFSEKDLEETMMNSAQKEYRKVITSDMLKMDWYVDHKEYGKYYWE